MIFKERRDAKTEVTFTGGDPLIYIMPMALDKMAWYVQGCDKEIGWLGKVVRQDNLFLIEDVYLFKQEVHSATCEITPEGLSDFVTDMYMNHSEIADDVINNLRLWGHSHVNMTVSPSAQDETQINDFKGANPWFIRVIANKSGEMEFSIFDFEQGMKFKNVKWMEYRVIRPSLEAEIKAEIASKVTTKSYVTNIGGYNSNLSTWKDGYEWNVDRRQWEKPVKKNNTEPRRTSQIGNGGTDNEFESYKYGVANMRNNKGSITVDFIEENFTISELCEIASCKSLTEASRLLDEIDVINVFTSLDIMEIYDYAQETYKE